MLPTRQLAAAGICWERLTGQEWLQIRRLRVMRSAQQPRRSKPVLVQLEMEFCRSRMGHRATTAGTIERSSPTIMPFVCCRARLCPSHRTNRFDLGEAGFSQRDAGAAMEDGHLAGAVSAWQL